ncbi:hypothetical protein ABBQ38_012649 [Trebouxia sp. C0009 RCD-2024]
MTMLGEKRRLSLKDAVEVEACRAVKRLQITRESPTSGHLPQVAAGHSWPSTGELVDAAQQLRLQCESPVSNAGVEPSSTSQSSSGPPGKQLTSLGGQDAGGSRGPPQRSLSSPDMSRFKFRLTPNKPPVHPVSSRTPLRQKSAVLAADLQLTADSGVLLKTTSDRHSDQERLFHQLDRKLTLHAPQHQPHSPMQNQRSPPFPTSVSKLSFSPSAHSPTALESAQTPVLAREVPKANTGEGRQSMMPVTNRHLQAPQDDDGSISSESCQPSTPIRGEDTPPTRDQQEQVPAESVFAAIYEQANVLLRNLHFERLNRRATSA